MYMKFVNNYLGETKENYWSTTSSAKINEKNFSKIIANTKISEKKNHAGKKIKIKSEGKIRSNAEASPRKIYNSCTNVSKYHENLNETIDNSYINEKNDIGIGTNTSREYDSKKNIDTQGSVKQNRKIVKKNLIIFLFLGLYL